MVGYMTCKEASKKWGISERQVQAYCKNGKIAAGKYSIGNKVPSIKINLPYSQ